MQQCHTFGRSDVTSQNMIGGIYVINLDRQPSRWAQVSGELRCVGDSARIPLATRTIRHTAIDARSLDQSSPIGNEVVPFYTLGDQLFVEPQPRILPDNLELDRPIRMSQPEVAVARSHISAWRRIAAGEHAYTLILEDDVWFPLGFARQLDRCWSEIPPIEGQAHRFDVLYLSYAEVKGGAPKTFISPNVFRPIRGLWCLSGYVLSRTGAQHLLSLLPCHGPVDLWLNQQFSSLRVLATKRSIISQRRDQSSTNSYSILPELGRIGVIDSGGESLFQIRPRERPVFAFGHEGSGLTSLAMALSMLGYRCCSDLEGLPEPEFERLLSGQTERVFDAYVNVGSLEKRIEGLHRRYPKAKFLVATNDAGNEADELIRHLKGLRGASFAVLPTIAVNKWKVLCEHLGCPPPACPFPQLGDIGQRQLIVNYENQPAISTRKEKRDKSPWIVEAYRGWSGVRTSAETGGSSVLTKFVHSDHFERLDTEHWYPRDDTFPGNLAMFRRDNVEFRPGIGAVLSVKKASLGIRAYSAGSISSRARFHYGRFEVSLRATNVPGVVTGFFLQRDTPRQEIDIEILGNRPDWLLINVFYNPGAEGSNYDYGYRGAPSRIKLGFDASADLHRYAIEWGPSLIRWFVDDRVVHERVNWDPTPIPHLPMTLHANTWPSRSRELAGRLAGQKLPVNSVVRSIAIEAGIQDRTRANIERTAAP